MTAHPSACRCEACSRFRHPSGRVLTEHDVRTLEAWSRSWPAPPDPRPAPVQRPPAGRVYDDAEQT